MISENEMFWVSVLGFLFVSAIIAFLDSLRKAGGAQGVAALFMMALLFIMGILNFTVGLP